jgi:hypothetical protein
MAKMIKKAKKRKNTKKAATKKAAAKKAGAKKAGTKKSAVKKALKKTAIKKTKQKPSKKLATKTSKKQTRRKPEKKLGWKISPENNSSIAEIDVWKKDDLTIEFVKLYRSGWIIVGEKPDLSGYDPVAGLDIYEEFEFIDQQLDDGSHANAVFPNELSVQERERLASLSETDLEDEGWTLESIIRFSGPLSIEQV